jgi:hypothetical protein
MTRIQAFIDFYERSRYAASTIRNQAKVLNEVNIYVITFFNFNKLAKFVAKNENYSTDLWFIADIVENKTRTIAQEFKVKARNEAKEGKRDDVLIEQGKFLTDSQLKFLYNKLLENLNEILQQEASKEIAIRFQNLLLALSYLATCGQRRQVIVQMTIEVINTLFNLMLLEFLLESSKKTLDIFMSF